jgi:hypothetical protein
MGAKVNKLIQEDWPARFGRHAVVRHGTEHFEVAPTSSSALMALLTDREVGGFKAGVRAPRLRPDLVHDRAATRVGQHVLCLARPEGPRIDAAEVSASHPAGIALPTGEWKRWRQEGVAAVANRVRLLDPIFEEFASGLKDFTPFFPLEGLIRLVDDWARDGLLLIGDAAHTIEPGGRHRRQCGDCHRRRRGAGAVSETWPRARSHTEDLQVIQRKREADVRTLAQAAARSAARAGGEGRRPGATVCCPCCCQ